MQEHYNRRELMALRFGADATLKRVYTYRDTTGLGESEIWEIEDQKIADRQAITMAKILIALIRSDGHNNFNLPIEAIRNVSSGCWGNPPDIISRKEFEERFPSTIKPVGFDAVRPKMDINIPAQLLYLKSKQLAQKRSKDPLSNLREMIRSKDEYKNLEGQKIRLSDSDSPFIATPYWKFDENGLPQVDNDTFLLVNVGRLGEENNYKR